MKYEESERTVYSENPLEQALHEHEVEQVAKTFECANKFDDLLKCLESMDATYKHIALEQCCFVFEKHIMSSK